MELEALYDMVRSSEGICTDSRSVKKGEVFFALKGPNHNGNIHAHDALKTGARAAVVDDPSVTGNDIYLVPDVLSSLNEMAVMFRKSVKVPVIAITGTNGKTTTKELIKAVLSMKYKVHATEGNLNNHIGVPLTLLRTPPDARMIVVEMGANHPGEIASHCNTAMPDYGLITNIGKAHLEGFGSFEGVIEAKSELYHYLRENCGIAFYNEKDPLLSDLIFKIVHKAVPYSDPSGTDLKVEDTGNDVLLGINVEYHGTSEQFETNLFGNHNLDNVRAAMAVGLFFDVPLNDVIEAIKSYRPGNNRSQVMVTEKNTVICDSYNANPSSMKRALASFSELRSLKKMIILGDMLELGSESLKEHRSVLTEAGSLEVGEVILCGPIFSQAATGKPFRSAADIKELREIIGSIRPEGYSILVKGSRGMMLEKVYDLL